MSVPDFCPQCGAYFECDCEPKPLAAGGYFDGAGRVLAEVDVKGDVIPGRGDPAIKDALQAVSRYIDRQLGQLQKLKDDEVNYG